MPSLEQQMGGGTPNDDPYGIPETPDWLNADDATDPLESELGNVDKYFNVNKYLRAMNRAAQSQFGTDLQEGQNAAGEAVQRSLQNGTQGSINSTMIAAQTALPGMNALLKTKSDAAGIALSAQVANQQARANLASSIADARTKYSGILASYITTIRGQNIQGATAQQGFALQGSAQNNQMTAMYAQILANPNSSAEMKDFARRQIGMGGGSSGGNGGGYVGYIPNAGPISPSSSYPGSVQVAY